MFKGLSAFPLTPFNNQDIDTRAFAGLVERLAASGVDSMGILGSTGSYAYLERAERKRVLRQALAHADGVPVIAGIGALRTRDVVELAKDAEDAGAAGLLLAPVSYHPLKEHEVYALFESVCTAVRTPICVYDNPVATHFRFSDELHGRIAALPNIASIKMPRLSDDPAEAAARVSTLRSHVPKHVTLGISGDAAAVHGLAAGCDGWYSVIGGLFPEVALRITHAALGGKIATAHALSARLAPLWALYDLYGGIRVMACAAALMGLCAKDCLPRPLLELEGNDQALVAEVLERLGLR
ncbi:dihydrodipicolinate synthase family protein [Stenotrophomonas maltophilia]|uniref:dihydrodipicolinate synthase family protein n=1 Tax=Stenotrophomonas maltophilia TaxID=40324 RepID=UPI0015DFA1F5|nr:dihydrodipicolinate synthase family protein [Stenotrophomonas maltophilia]MBA0280841.1 dihydrodipicolinate synthase family protein [Stenotrophomonas maltophilia]MBA0344209.1 dihydrodipicolinate synthase family protein [Stenotrophomonas maltophilia]MBA0356991.1 dihydrodipicolinate synthase family protein [Stenotrophomonas maltophilia]MBA0518926.1 dihydrodipicolinate synthase family protein [Stenotrophomonas maltophilia]